MNTRDAIVLVWFALSILMEIISTLVLMTWLRRRKVPIVFGLTGIPGYLEHAYADWCRSHGEDSKRLLVIRGLLLLNVVLAAVITIPILVAR